MDLDNHAEMNRPNGHMMHIRRWRGAGGIGRWGGGTDWRLFYIIRYVWV